MEELQKLRQQILFDKAIGLGLCAVLTSLFVEHAKALGTERETAIQQTRKVLDESLSSLSAKGTAPDGEKVDWSPNVHRGVTRLLNYVEVSARRMLGQPESTSKAQ